jgi:hypothetical protein
MRAARGEAGVRALADAALGFARRSGDAQMLFPTLSDAALIASTSGDSDASRRVAELFDELVEAAPDTVQGSYWSTGFALALALTDQPERLSVLDATGPSRWLSTASLIGQGRYAEAAHELAEIGARPEEALTRMLAGRGSIRAGDRADGEAELRRAVAFWASVGAAGYVEVAELLLARTA